MEPSLDTYERATQADRPMPAPALESFDDGLNRLEQEVERLTHRLAAVLVPGETRPGGSDVEGHPTTVHAQVARLHGLVRAVSAVTDRVAL